MQRTVKFRLGTALIIAGLLLAIAAPVFGGGWAVATLDDIPSDVVAGQAFTVSFTMRQHGLRPVDWGPMKLTFRNTATGETATYTAWASSHDGQYVVDITLPSAGVWEWTIGEGFVQPMPNLTVKDTSGAAASPSSTAAPAITIPNLIGILGLMGVAGGLLALVRTRRPWAAGLALGAAMVAALSLVLPSAASRPAAPLGEAPASQAELGQALFLAKGCVVCHTHASVAEMRSRTLGQFSTGPDLSHFSAKPEYLRSWLNNPASIKPEAQMPQLNLKAHEIEALIAFINSESQ